MLKDMGCVELQKSWPNFTASSHLGLITATDQVLQDQPTKDTDLRFPCSWLPCDCWLGEGMAETLQRKFSRDAGWCLSKLHCH